MPPIAHCWAATKHPITVATSASGSKENTMKLLKDVEVMLLIAFSVASAALYVTPKRPVTPNAAPLPVVVVTAKRLMPAQKIAALNEKRLQASASRGHAL